jgi:transposase InsO family protein
MNQIVAAHRDREIHVVLDNLSTHKPKRDMWLKRHKNVRFHYTPTHASWPTRSKSGSRKSLSGGRIYQQTFIDTYSKVAFAKLYDRKTPITAADLLNDRVVPFFEAQEVKLCRTLTDRGTEYCGNPEHHEYELYLAIEDIDHSRTKTKSPQTNGIVERFHKTVLDEFYRIAFRKKIYGSIAELQADLDAWVETYNEDRPHQGRWCFGKTPMQTFLDATPLAKEKLIAA